MEAVVNVAAEEGEKPSSLYLAVSLLRDFRQNMQEIEDYQRLRQRLLVLVTVASLVAYVCLLSLAFWVEYDNLAYSDAFFWHGFPMSRVVAAGAGITYLLQTLALGMPLVLREDPLSLQSARFCVTCVLGIAAVTNMVIAAMPVPLVVNVYTGCVVNMARWCEWVVLSFLMTFLVEIVDAKVEEALFTGLLQGISTLCGILFPYAPSHSSFIGLLVLSVVLYVYLFHRFRRAYRKYHRLAQSDSLGGLCSIVLERSLCALHLMRLCCVFWTVFVLTYFFEWALNAYFQHEQPEQYMFIVDTVVEVFCKFFYGTYILFLQEQLLDPSAARRQRVQLIRNTMHVIWQSSHDIIVLSFPEQTHVSPGFHALIGIDPGPEFKLESDSSGLRELIQLGWQDGRSEFILDFSLTRKDKNTVECEVRIRKLERPRVLVIIIRDISERVRLRSVEQQVMIQEVERRKDIEATRFTRHEVKNGILDAKEQLRSLQENFDNLLKKGLMEPSAHTDLCYKTSEIAQGLDETLDAVAGNVVAKDIVNELYVPKREPFDIADFIREICSICSLETSPSPFPKLDLDPQIMSFICKNALSNAHKYGKKNGVINTRLAFKAETETLSLEIENEAGPNHECLLELQDSSVIFTKGWRLAENIELCHSISSGDGGWVMKKCVDVIEGTCSYQITPTSTTFVMSCPAQKSPTEGKQLARLPDSLKVLAVDDSRIQVKLMQRLFVNLGVDPSAVFVHGETVEEIKQFPQFVIQSIRSSPDSTFLVVIDDNLDYLCPDTGVMFSRKGSEMIRPILNGIRDIEAKVVVVMRSANNGGDDKQKYFELGAHGTLDKAVLDHSVILDTLYKAILEHCPEAFEPSKGSKRKAQPPDVKDATDRNKRRKPTRREASSSTDHNQQVPQVKASAASSSSSSGLRRRKRKR